MKLSMLLLPTMLLTGCDATTESHPPRADTTSGATGPTAGSAGSAGTINVAGTASSAGTAGAAAVGSAGKAGAGASGSAGSDPGAPAPKATWVNATGNLAGMSSDCVSVGRVAAQPGSTRVFAGVGLQGLFSSEDSGQTWQALGSAAGSASITNRTSSITFDPEHPDVFWETGSHNGGGLYRTIDGGETFVELGPLSMTQNLAVDFSDPERGTLLTSTHGAGVYRSTDAGVTFTSVGGDLPGATLWPLMIDSQTHLLATFDSDANNPINGIHRSTNGGTSWTLVSGLAPSHDGGFVRTSDDSIYLPLAGNSGLAKSTDLGLTWVEMSGSTAAFATPFFGIDPLELPGEKLVTLGIDHLLMSLDGGANWEPIGEPLPFEISPTYSGGVTYSVATKTFFIWHSTCPANVVLDDGIMSAGYDYTLP